LVRQGHFIRAQTLLTQVVASLERVVNWQQWVYNLSFLGIALAAQGQIAAGMAAGERALARAQAAENSTATLSSHLVLAIIHLMTGDIQRMLAESRTGLTAAEQSGDRLFGYIGLGLLVWAESRLGNDEAAQELIARSQTANQELGGQLLLSDWFAAAAAEIALTAGHPEESLTLAEQAVAQAQSVDGLFAQGLAHRVWAAALWQREGSIIMKGEGEFIRPSAWQPFDYVQGSLRSGQALSPDSLKAVEAHLRASLQAFESGGAWLEAARTHGVWGCLCRNHNDDAAVRHHFEQAAARFETFGLDNELAQIRRWQAESGASYDPRTD
jgi:hypothetical protein